MNFSISPAVLFGWVNSGKKQMRKGWFFKTVFWLSVRVWITILILFTTALCSNPEYADEDLGPVVFFLAMLVFGSPLGLLIFIILVITREVFYDSLLAANFIFVVGALLSAAFIFGYFTLWEIAAYLVGSIVVSLFLFIREIVFPQPDQPATSK
jgi:lysylphosphatidylglycerol synthetase-like protein (DUF2156 family)